MEIKTICKAFGLFEDIISCDVIKSGNINNTFKVTISKGQEKECYIIQQINTYVFKDPIRMMQNISRVTGHIANKMGEERERRVLKFLQAEDGNFCFVDDEGKYWRAYKFIDNSVTYDTCDDLYVLEQAGFAFGEFQMMLGDFDASLLFETIPDFHNSEKRLCDLFSHVEEDPLGRCAETRAEIAFFEENRERAKKLIGMQRAGLLPVRVTHNDTKCNNVLFDTETKKALAVIDLDTVMPGLALYDYGDAVRFCANTAKEDEKDVSKISLDIEKFRAFTKGYLDACGKVLTDSEKANLIDGVIVMTIENAGRFLDDYLTGDKYFKTDYPGHNLVRTRAQITLARDIIEKYDRLNAIVSKIV